MSGSSIKNAQKEQKDSLLRENSEFDDLTEFAFQLGYLGPAGEKIDEVDSYSNAMLNSSSTPPVSAFAPQIGARPHSRRKGPAHEVAQKETESTKAEPHVPRVEKVSPESIMALITVLKASIIIQEETADMVSKRILNPLGLRISRAPKGKVTLAEMTRHLRLDRVLEALEGAIFAEKKLAAEEASAQMPLRSDLRDQLHSCVHTIKVSTEEMMHEWHPTLTGAGLEAKIARLQNATEAILHEVQHLLRSWLSIARSEEGDKSYKVIQTMKAANYRVTEMIALLPPKYYIPDDVLARSASSASTLSFTRVVIPSSDISTTDTVDSPSMPKKAHKGAVRNFMSKLAGHDKKDKKDKHDKKDNPKKTESHDSPKKVKIEQ